MVIDLQAHRCPTAQVLMNRALELFMKSDEDELVIISIEPSLLRNTEARIVGLDFDAGVSSVSHRDITDQDLKRWSCKFDSDDFGDVRIVQTIKVQKNPRRSAGAKGDQAA